MLILSPPSQKSLVACCVLPFLSFPFSSLLISDPSPLLALSQNPYTLSLFSGCLCGRVRNAHTSALIRTLPISSHFACACLMLPFPPQYFSLCNLCGVSLVIGFPVSHYKSLPSNNPHSCSTFVSTKFSQGVIIENGKTLFSPLRRDVTRGTNMFALSSNVGQTSFISFAGVETFPALRAMI